MDEFVDSEEVGDVSLEHPPCQFLRTKERYKSRT